MDKVTTEKRGRSERGFGLIEFEDSKKKGCRISCSSAIGPYEDSFDRPGSSFLWLGPTKVVPKIMANHAKKLGIQTDETTGWIEFSVPKEVFIDSSMHLNRDQVKQLIGHLQEWLNNGEFKQ